MAPTTFYANKMPQGTIWFYSDVKGSFTQNTFTQSPQESDYVFEFKEYASPTPNGFNISQNCIERDAGAHFRSVSGTVELQDNWWGDPTGPYYNPSNLEGKGASISVTSSPDLTVQYKSYEETRPSFCDANPMAAVVTLTTTIGPAGGTVYIGPMTLTFPAGAVSSETQLVSSGSLPVGKVSAAGAPPTGDLIGTVFFQLSAMDASTSSEITSFAKAYDLVVYYDPRTLAAKEATIGLYWLDGTEWTPVPGTVVDTDEHTIWVSFDKLGQFAILGEGEIVYLPTLLDSQ